jgi:ABC-type multidrug transport system ATPase subunit
MLLVLGRPGSGCSTFLKAVANKRGGFAGVHGDVSYGGIPAEEQIRSYRGEVNYNQEDDQHFPTLTVGQTLEFSLLNKTRKHEKGDIPVIIGALLKIFGITHTCYTLVGDVSHCLPVLRDQIAHRLSGIRTRNFWRRKETCLNCGNFGYKVNSLCLG